MQMGYLDQDGFEDIPSQEASVGVRHDVPGLLVESIAALWSTRVGFLRVPM